ncbi:MAG: hydrogenase expression protein [Ardenticatenales bacterium]|nr:hydrogenase expression protein [Ardenticatenales bacterium]
MNNETTFGTGKLPPDFLARLLARYGSTDPRLVVRPGLGLDAAVLDLGDQYLVAKSDPITFATSEIGWYAVHVNANDVACMGGTPHWFLATLLLPPGSSATLIASLFAQIHEACASLSVTLVGGHTEISHGLERPLVAGTMLGTMPKAALVTPADARPGDHLVVAKGFPIEGTAIIAHERAEELRARGWSEAEIAEAQCFLHEPGISVVRAARIAAGAVPLHGMHDPTEGGLATGLREMAQAAGLGLRVHSASLPLLPLAARLCAAFDLDPLGTIASGALCIVVAPQHSPALLAALSAENIPAVVVGKLLAAGSGEWLVTGEEQVPLPTFTVDEITRLF